jgi:hypothetical protein
VSSGLAIRSGAGMRPIRRRGFAVVEDGRRFAIVDRASGEVIAYAGLRAASRLARRLRVLDLTAEQLARQLDDERLLSTITVEYGGPCWRCGGRIEPGARARYNGDAGLLRHLRRCPRPVAQRRGARGL